MSRYPDASFLYALYREQSNSVAASDLRESSSVPLPVTEPLLYEFRQSLRLQIFLREKDFRKGFSKSEAEAILNKMEANLASGTLVMVSVDLRAVFQRAEFISSRHTEAGGYRSFDILHVATAKQLGAREFLSFDGNQRRLAAAEGLTVLPAAL